MEKNLKRRLLSLTWDELCAWADPRSVARGKGYLSCVEPPVLFPDDAATSWRCWTRWRPGAARLTASLTGR